jgi:hypothetical protein
MANKNTLDFSWMKRGVQQLVLVPSPQSKATAPAASDVADAAALLLRCGFGLARPRMCLKTSIA